MTTEPSPDEVDVDPLLVLFVAAHNAMSGGGLSIVVITGGTMFAGTLASHADYTTGLGEALGAAFAAAGAADAGKATKELFDRAGGESVDDARSDDAPPPKHIHLRDVRVFNPQGTAVSGTIPWLRIRLARVDGWFFGTLAPGR